MVEGGWVAGLEATEVARVNKTRDFGVKKMKVKQAEEGRRAREDARAMGEPQVPRGLEMPPAFIRSTLLFWFRLFLLVLFSCFHSMRIWEGGPQEEGRQDVVSLEFGR